jgi:peptide/nickel transport system permease protein
MRLRTYVIRRLLFAIFAFFFVSLFIFTVIDARPVGRMLMTPYPGRLPEAIQRLIKEWGLDQPFFVRYLMFMSKFLQGDLGFSFMSGKPVVDMIAQRLPYTLELMFTAQIVSVATAIVLGVISALKKHPLVSSVSSLGARIVYSAPNFWIALMAILVFSVGLGWFPVSEARTFREFASLLGAWVDHLAYLTLPALVLAVGWTPYYFRKVKSSMIRVLEQDYITTARAKGQKEMIVVLKHALSNALLTLLKYEGYLIGFLISSTVVIEYIFGWFGLGTLFIESLWLRDSFAIWGVSLTITLMILFVSICTDITYRVVNPRMRRTPN